MQSAAARKPSPRERRKSRRYALTIDARILASGKPGTGVLQNLSSGGAFLKTEIRLLPGEPLKLFVDWPMKRSIQFPLVLELLGTVIRTDQFGIAVAIARHEWTIGSPKQRGKQLES